PRIRIALAQVDTDFVTLSIGQTWNLMAFAAAYLPTSVQPQGLPGQLFGRNPQVRLSHIFDAKVFSVEAAAAAVRSPQFDAEMPDLQGGLKFNINGWTGVQSIGSTATVVSPASIAVTGSTRKIKMASAVSGANALAYDTVAFRALLVGAQFSLGKVVLAGSYSNVYSDNAQQFAGTWNQQAWWDANLFVDPWTGVRFGLEFARTLQRRTTNQLANNSRVFFGTFFLF